MSSTTARDILDERVTAFEGTMSVDNAIESIRDSTTGSEHTVYYAFVLDSDGKLEGVVSLRELLNADDDEQVADVATDAVVFVNVSDPIDQVGKVFARNKYMALPVVNDDEELLGLIHSNSVIEALDERGSKEVLRETIRDVEYDPGEESAYECFSCGTIVTAVDNPGACPNCGDSLRNRQTPIE